MIVITVTTPDGELRWSAGRVEGDAAALAQLELPRPGDFGCVPGVPWGEAVHRSDAFLHLVATIWPAHSVQGEPDDEDPGEVIY